MTDTLIPETKLVELRAKGFARRNRFVDPRVLAKCSNVLARRGERWAASVLGRDISRRSLMFSDRPFLKNGEEYILVLADGAEDEQILSDLAL